MQKNIRIFFDFSEFHFLLKIFWEKSLFSEIPRKNMKKPTESNKNVGIHYNFTVFVIHLIE